MGRTGTLMDFASHSDFIDTDIGMDENGVVNRGEPAKFQEVVQYIAPWSEKADGLAEHSRRCARALADAGEVVHLLNQRLVQDVDPEVEATVKDLTDVDAGSARLRLIQGVPSDAFLSKYVTHRFLTPEGLAARNSCTVFYVVTEYEGISSQTASLYNRAGQVWTACSRSKRMLEASGVEGAKLHVVPIPFFPNDPLLKLQGRKRRPGPPRFLHIGKWEARKAQHEILGAFMLAFKPGKAQFVIKTSKHAPKFRNYPSHVGESVRRWLEDERVRANGWSETTIHPSIRMITEQIPADKIVALHEWSDCYVSLAHGEGFDMPAFDAKIAGNRLVYTASGGPEDFAAEDDLAVPFEGHEPADPWYEWGEQALWTKSTADGAVDSLRKAAELVGTHATPIDATRFSAESVGARMKSLLEPIGRRP